MSRMLINPYAIPGQFGTHDWSDINEADSSGDNSADTWVAPTSGNVRISISGVSGSGILRVRPNLGGVAAGSNIICSNGATDDFFVTAGQNWYFQGTITGLPGDSKGCTVTVIDLDHGSATIDTFTHTLAVP